MGCQAPPFSDSQVASTVTAAAFEKFAECRLRLLEVDLVGKMEHQKREEIKKELDKLRNMDEQERRVRAAAMQIHDLLTNACPRCQQAFLDFDACCALSCSRCPCNYCAWCLKDCGADAHAHVRHCPHNLAPGRDLFATEEVWREGRRRVRREAVTRFLRGLGAELAKKVAKETEPQLSDPDVGLSDVAQAFMA